MPLLAHARAPSARGLRARGSHRRALLLLGIATAGVAGADAPIPVSVATATASVVSEELRLTGTLTAERRAGLSPRIDGLVARLRVDAGDRVKAGQVLLELDEELAEHAARRAAAGAEQAKAARDEAQRLFEEAQRLVQDKHLPRTELERREAELRLSEAALTASLAAEREQQELLRRHALPAPFAGLIARRMTDVGEWVTRGTPVLELVALDRIRLDLQAPQEYFRLINDKARVEVRSDGAPDRVLAGRIAARVPVGDAAARSFLIRVVVDDPPIDLLPGASASAVIQLPGDEQSVSIPRDALLRYPDGAFSVFVVRDAQGRSTAHEQRVRVGRGDEQVEILEGLKPGERVVVRGNETLRTGQAVVIQAGG